MPLFDRSSRVRRLTVVALGSLLLGALVVGCSSDDDELIPNDPPETRMISAPSPDLPVGYRVSLAWLGTDPDGVVESYEWRISDDGADGVVDVEDTLGLPWHRTVRTDSLFEASTALDSFPADVENPLITDPIDFRWWQNHTFWVRAIDNNGTVDSSPASARFTATTTAPKVEIDIPTVLPRSMGTTKLAPCFGINPVLAIGIETIDLDDPLGYAPLYRYAVLAVEDLDPQAYAGLGIPALQPGDCLGEEDFSQLDLLPWIPESTWSDWQGYVDTEDPEIDFVLPRFETGGSWFLFLQAEDRAGARTPTFRYDRNFFEFAVEGSFTPVLTVEDPSQTEHVFEGEPMLAVHLDLEGDGSYSFRWSGDASAYAGVVTGFRFAVDPVDPFAVDELEWNSPWSPTPLTVLELGDGLHDLVVAARDNSDAVTHAVFELSVTNLGN